MAEGALFHLAGKVINVLRSFIAEEVKLACGVKTEIKNLKSTVTYQKKKKNSKEQSPRSKLYF